MWVSELSIVWLTTCAALSARSGSLRWEGLDVGAESSPGERMKPGVCTHEGFVYVFGGRDREGIHHNDVWVFDMEYAEWTLLSSDGVGDEYPDAREDALSGVYGNTLYVSCGHGGSQRRVAIFGDLWGFDLITRTWRQTDRNATDVPEPRFGMAGGVVGDKFVVSHGFSSRRLDDTLSYDLAGKRGWEREQEEGPPAKGEVKPSRRSQVGTTTSNKFGEMFLIGGCTEGESGEESECPAPDFWGYNVETNKWRKMTPPPVATKGGDISTWPDLDGVVLVGGEGVDDSKRRVNDVHFCNRSEATWSSYVASDGGALSGKPLEDMRLAMYSGNNNEFPRVVLFGGEGTGGRMFGLYGDIAASRKVAVGVDLPSAPQNPTSTPPPNFGLSPQAENEGGAGTGDPGLAWMSSVQYALTLVALIVHI